MGASSFPQWLPYSSLPSMHGTSKELQLCSPIVLDLKTIQIFLIFPPWICSPVEIGAVLLKQKPHLLSSSPYNLDMSSLLPTYCVFKRTQLTWLMCLVVWLLPAFPTLSGTLLSLLQLPSFSQNLKLFLGHALGVSAATFFPSFLSPEMLSHII